MVIGGNEQELPFHCHCGVGEYSRASSSGISWRGGRKGSDGLDLTVRSPQEPLEASRQARWLATVDSPHDQSYIGNSQNLAPMYMTVRTADPT